MLALENFKKFRDTKLAKILHNDAVLNGKKKKTDKLPQGHFVLKNETCEALVKGNPYLDKNDLLKVKGIGKENFKLFGDAIYDYFTRSSNF